VAKLGGPVAKRYGVRLAIKGSWVRAPAVTLLRNNLRQVVHTPLPHSRDTPRGGL